MNEPSVSQSVKEVIQSLVDDGLVNSDKIGSSNCASSHLHVCALLNIYAPSLLEFSLPTRIPRKPTACAILSLFDSGFQMQTRLLTFQETRTNLQTQLAELRATIETEKALRLDSVCTPFLLSSCLQLTTIV